MLAARREDQLARLAQYLSNQTGARVSHATVDLATREGVEKAVDAVMAKGLM
jgi:short-subunit dehydrogenase